MTSPTKLRSLQCWYDNQEPEEYIEYECPDCSTEMEIEGKCKGKDIVCCPECGYNNEPDYESMIADQYDW